MNNLTVEKIGKIKWRLVKPFKYSNIIVPKGFETDLATAVRTWARDADEAAVVHDYMLSTEEYDRYECDVMFYDVMLHTNVNPIKAKIMYLAVRLYSIINIAFRMK